MSSSPRILLTFDVEEFDTPLDYGLNLELEEQISVSTQGMRALQSLLTDWRVPTTLFTTATYALHEQAFVRELATQHEIASHGYYHGSYEPADLARSKQALEAITGQPVRGFRRARMMPVDERDLQRAGYQYNSSMHPTWLPGRYNHLSKPRTPYRQAGILNIPPSVSPRLRIPLFWLGFKNYPLSVFRRLSADVLHDTGLLHLYFHPWEFTDLSEYRLPTYVRRYAGEPLLDRLDQFLEWVQPRGTFATLAEVAQN
jgi:hypothetical protein